MPSSIILDHPSVKVSVAPTVMMSAHNRDNNDSDDDPMQDKQQHYATPKKKKATQHSLNVSDKPTTTTTITPATKKTHQSALRPSSISSSSPYKSSSPSSPASSLLGRTRSSGGGCRVTFSDNNDIQSPSTTLFSMPKISIHAVTSPFRKGNNDSEDIRPKSNKSSMRRTVVAGKENDSNSGGREIFSKDPEQLQKNETTNNNSSPRKWNLGRRFSLFGTGMDGVKRKNGYGTLDDVVDVEVPPTPTSSEADPVMTIFESRNTQRVRFSLEGVEGGDVSPVVGVGNGVGSSSTAAISKEGIDGPVGKAGFGGIHEKHTSNSSNSGTTGVGAGNIKQFMSRALFGSSKGGNGTKKLSQEEMEREVKEIGGESLIWESATTPTGPEVIHTHNGRVGANKQSEVLLLSFTEDPKARAAVTKLLSKARRAEHVHFRYEYAVKCYLKALSILKKAKYRDDHPTVAKTVRLLNNAHHVLSSYNNSANIVKMGIKNEDAGELVKALKMYTIAYRIRRDNLSRNHPSLVVLLNMLGSIQIKRGELREAMQIYELALKDSPVIFSAAGEDDGTVATPAENLLAKSVTYRELGTIYEMWGNVDEALKFYHKSLECVAEWRDTVQSTATNNKSTKPSGPNNSNNNNRKPTESPRSSSAGSVMGGEDCSTTDGSSRSGTGRELNYCIDNVQPISCVGDRTESGSGLEQGGMELVIGTQLHNGTGVITSTSGNAYERFFPKTKESEPTADGPQVSDDNSYADMDLSLTLHQIAQLYRSQGKFARALDAYEVALRGMKTALGKHHPNVAAVLGNIGNMQKEMGDLDAAHKTYQEVLGIESYRLGLSHPDVAITLHNIATIDAARGNYEHSLQLYRKVIGLQKKLFGEDNVSVAVTAACMGDVYEKIGEIQNAMDSFDEAVRIKTSVLGRHSLDVGRLLHKLGKLSFVRRQYVDAESYVARAVLIYRLNKVGPDHEWLLDAIRDNADIVGAMAMENVDQGEI